MFQGGFARKKRPGAAQKDRRLSEGLGEVIGGGMAGSRIFFKKLLKSTAQGSSAAAGLGSAGRRGGAGGPASVQSNISHNYDLFRYYCSVLSRRSL